MYKGKPSLKIDENSPNETGKIMQTQFSTDGQDISDAVDLLKDLIDATPASNKRDSLLGEAAAEFNVNPILLARMFAQSFGDVKAYTPPTPENKAATAKARFDKAMKVATKWGAQYKGVPAAFGKTFKYEREEYIFVVIQRNQPKWGLKGVRVSDATEHEFPSNTWEAITKQLR